MYKDIKWKLREYKNVIARKKEFELRLEELNQGIGYRGGGVEEPTGKTNKIQTPVEDEAIRLTETKKELEKLISKNKVDVMRIENALSVLKEKERQAIELTYIQGYKLETTCYKLDRSINSVKKYISSGLKKMNNIINL